MKTSINSFPPLYIITQEHISNFSDFLKKLEHVLSSVPNNSIMLQLREKHLSDREFYTLALKMRTITETYKTLFIINERIDIALLCKADGVQITSTSIRPNQARKLLGDGIVGISTHSQNEVIQAQQDGANLVTLGPIFETPSKINMGKPLGTSILSVQKRVSIPVYALGGIQSDNIESLAKKHKNLAMISMVWNASDLSLMIRSILSKIQ